MKSDVTYTHGIVIALGDEKARSATLLVFCLSMLSRVKVKLSNKSINQITNSVKEKSNLFPKKIILHICGCQSSIARFVTSISDQTPNANMVVYCFQELQFEKG